MTCPNNEMSDLAGCSDMDNVTFDEDFHGPGLDVRVTFRDGGDCENQTIRRLDVEHNGMIVYTCSNILSAFALPCESNEKFQVVTDPECSPSCASNDLQCCKFSIFLNFTSFSTSDVGRYVATVQFFEDGMQRRLMTKTFNVGTEFGMF